MADKTKARPSREPADLDLLSMALGRIPYMLDNIDFARRALQLEKQYGLLEHVEVFRDHPDRERLSYSTLGSYTQPIISMAAIQCRVLLEFLGLGVTKKEPYRLIARTSERGEGDIGIEDFTNQWDEQLKRLTPEEALKRVPNPVRAELAWVTTVHVANLRLAHPTDDYKLAGRTVRSHLYNAFRSVPILVRSIIGEARHLPAKRR
jgi:hypothetical protein